jgi:hypothetical protein
VNGVSTCGTNATSLSAGDPVVTSSYDTADNLYSLKNAVMDAHKDGSPALPTLNPTSLNTSCGCTDYTLGWDVDRDTRSSTSTRPGVDD